MLAWIFRRCEDAAEAVETPVGLLPGRAGGIDTDGPRRQPRRRWSSCSRSTRRVGSSSCRRCTSTSPGSATSCRSELREQLDALEARLSGSTTPGARSQPWRLRSSRPTPACSLLQAGVVAAPAADAAARGWLGALARPRVGAGAARRRSSVVIFAIRYVSDTATGLTYLALVAVPPLAAVALGLGDARRRGRGSALVAVPLFALAWATAPALAGEAAAALLSGAQLRDARRAAGRRDAGRLAEGWGSC